MRRAKRFRNGTLFYASGWQCFCPPACQSSPTSCPGSRSLRRRYRIRQIPQLVDITRSTKIQFDHLSSPAKKYIVESMSGGVALIDYDRDGWPDIYFTNAPGIDMALAGRKARSALLPQQPRRHVYRCHGKGRRRLSLLGHGGLHWRLRQRRLARSVSHLLWRGRPLPQQSRWHLQQRNQPGGARH